MTTINSYSVSLALDASSYIRNSSLSRKETQSLVREINMARTPADKYERSINLIDKAVKQGAIDQATYNRLLDSAKSKFSSASVAASAFGSSVRSYVAGFAGAAALKTVISDSVKLAAESESAAIQFEVLTGSVSDAATMVKGLRDLAASTPLNVTDTQKAARTMLSFGVATDAILPTLKQLGDVTGGNSQRFEMMSLAFAQVSAAGRLMGQDLLQMVNAGFNPLQEISRKTGESLIALKKRMEAGGISASEVAEALRSATSEGGLFFGMIDRMAETTEGKFAKLRDSIDSIKRDLGESFLPLVNEILDASAVWARDFKVGMGALQSERGFNAARDEREAMKKIAEQQIWFEEQQRRRKAGLPGMRSESSLALGRKSDEQSSDFTASHAIESAITTSIESLKTGAGGIVDAMRTFQDAAVGISMAGMAQTQELATELKEDPAVQNLQVGTQQAYEYLTKATRDVERQTALEAQRKRQLDENARAQREKMNQYLDRINTALENNGWKRIR